MGKFPDSQGNHFFTDSFVVFGVRERGGDVRLAAVPNVTGATLKKHVRNYVDSDAKMVCADQFNAHNQLAAEFTMEQIQHNREYVQGEVHTQSIESIWAIVKRQVNGTHHKLSKQYLPLYLNEISYRFNHRWEPYLHATILGNALQVDDEVVLRAAA